MSTFEQLAHWHGLDAESWIAVIWNDDDNKLDGIYGPFPNAGDAMAYIESFRAWLAEHGENNDWVAGYVNPLRPPTDWTTKS